MRFLNGDVVDVRATVGDLDDLVFPLLFLEPLPLVDVVGERLLLAGQTEANLVEELLGRCAHDHHVPAPVLLWPAPAENAEVQQDELHLLAHHLAGGAEDDALPSGVAIAIEVRAKERSDDFLWGPKNGLWDLLVTCTRAVSQTQFLDEEVRNILRMNQHAVPAIIPLHDATQSEESVDQRCEVLDALDVRSGESEMVFDPADVAVSDQVPKECAQVGAYLIRHGDHFTFGRQLLLQSHVLSAGIERQRGRHALGILANTQTRERTSNGLM